LDLAMTKTDSWPGRIALMVAHCAGMVDLVALPVWVGTLVTSYQLDPQQAGGLATLFLVGAVASSLFFAPRFNRIRGRTAASGGFGMAAVAFFGVSLTNDYTAMAALHALAGFAAGCGLTVTHGTIGRSANPHRLFALVGIALGVFAIVFLGATPKLVAATGGATLFRVFAGVMLVGALVAVAAFPAPDQSGEDLPGARKPFAAPVWFAIAGISCMALVQAMTFSFVERIGIDRGFGLDAVTGVLITLGFVNLVPAPLAALLERRLSANTVVLAGPVAQAALALVITHASSFAPYAAASSLFVAVMIFTHTFAFGLVAKLDPTGRALAATPAMLMVGAATGPVLGGTFVKAMGYGSIGFAAIVIAGIALTSFACVRRMSVQPTSAA
jgi:predicted MFS family arabinose efflux permease